MRYGLHPFTEKKKQKQKKQNKKETKTKTENKQTNKLTQTSSQDNVYWLTRPSMEKNIYLEICRFEKNGL